MAVTNQFSSTVESLFKGMENFVTTKTVVGDPIQLKGAVILPLVDVSFGCAAGANANNVKSGAGGGLGGKITLSAVLVLQNGTARLVNIKNQDTVTNLLDMVPDLVNKFTKSSGPEEVTDEEIIDAVQKDKDQ